MADESLPSPKSFADTAGVPRAWHEAVCQLKQRESVSISGGDASSVSSYSQIKFSGDRQRKPWCPGWESTHGRSSYGVANAPYVNWFDNAQPNFNANDVRNRNANYGSGSRGTLFGKRPCGRFRYCARCQPPSISPMDCSCSSAARYCFSGKMSMACASR